MPSVTITPLKEAIAKLDRKSVVASRLRSKEWAQVPVQIRERAFFSAGVNQADWLAGAQKKLQDSLAMRTEAVGKGKTAFVDRSSFIGDMRKQVLASGMSDGTGGITDLASRARQGLIYDMQIGQAQGFARLKVGMDPDILDAFPAQELIREEARQRVRNWQARWRDAGGKLVDGRMVALKTDPIWTNLSRFQVPWPPFDYGSGMGLRDIDRDEAVSLGLLTATETLKPAALPGYNDGLEASVSDIPDDIRDPLLAALGDLVQISGDVIRWVKT